MTTYKEGQRLIPRADGKTLALDSTLWISRCYFSSYDKRQGLHRWHDILGRLRMNGVEPICIFDGPSRPKQKHLTNLSRATKREEAGTRLETERQIQRHLASLEEAASLPEEEKRVAYSSTLSLLRDAIVEAPEPALIPSPPVPLPPPVTPEPKLHRDHRQLVAFLEPLISQDKPAEESELEAVEAELTALGLQSADRKVRFGRAAHAMPSEFTQACIVRPSPSL